MKHINSCLRSDLHPLQYADQSRRTDRPGPAPAPARQGESREWSENATCIKQPVAVVTKCPPTAAGRAEEIRDLPDELCNLTNLKELDISNNELKAIPARIGEMKNLEKLVAAYNNITYLPKSLTELVKLKCINIRGNKLSSLPSDFGQLQSLEEIDLKENLLVRPPKLVCEGGKRIEIEQYLKYAYAKDKIFLEKTLQLIPKSIPAEGFEHFCKKLRLPSSDITSLGKLRMPLEEKIKSALIWWQDHRVAMLEPGEATEELIRTLDKADLNELASKVRSLKICTQAIKL
ncbi:leucine-rich repeat and death domain-containing protein 1-like [Mobula hypostoma]|uniref:leucine-rich repeat and death domain-containing protein 1-like n=1 Tax=Mobula hypostoma TaxID=723540 RepID=UPI002FC2D16D